MENSVSTDFYRLEVSQKVDQESELRLAMEIMTTFSEGGERVNEGISTPTADYISQISVKHHPETDELERSWGISLQDSTNGSKSCAADAERFETVFLEMENNGVYTQRAEEGTMETMPLETEINGIEEDKDEKIETMPLETESNGIETEKDGLVLVALDGLKGLSGGFHGLTFIGSTEVLESRLVSVGGDEVSKKAAEEVLVDPCERAEEFKQEGMDLCHGGHTTENDESSVLVGLDGQCKGHSREPCIETRGVKNVEVSNLMVDVLDDTSKPLEESIQQVAVRFQETRDIAKQVAVSYAVKQVSVSSAVKQVAVSSKGTQSAVEQITVSSEEMQIAVEQFAVSFEKTQIAVEQVRASSEETDDAAEDAAVSSEETQNVVELVAVSSPGTQNAMKIWREGTVLVPSNLEALKSRTSKGDPGPEFFSNARELNLVKKIEEQDCTPRTIEVLPKTKHAIESPHSLRALLASENRFSRTNRDEKPYLFRKDGKGVELSSRVVPASESTGSGNHLEHNHEYTSDTFSSQIAYLGAFTYLESLSHRSDSSTSGQSFAFPILASDWNTSPVKIGHPDVQFFRQRRKWHFCFCCRCPLTLLD